MDMSMSVTPNEGTRKKAKPILLLSDNASVVLPHSPHLAQLVPSSPSAQSPPQHKAFEALTLNDILQKSLDNVEQIDELLSYLKSLKAPYSALYPLKRVKGCLMKVHRLKLNSYQRYIYINPIEGVLVSYQGVNKFPISPNYILKLNEIQEAKLIQDSGWYKKKNNYYFLVKTATKKTIFFTNNLDLVQFWVNEILHSQKFYSWLQAIIDKRYNQKTCSIYSCDESNSQEYLDKADELINFLLNVKLPEIDIDQYKINMGISASEYAIKKTNEFRSSFFSNSQSGGTS